MPQVYIYPVTNMFNESIVVPYMLISKLEYLNLSFAREITNSLFYILSVKNSLLDAVHLSDKYLIKE